MCQVVFLGEVLWRKLLAFFCLMLTCADCLAASLPHLCQKSLLHRQRSNGIGEEQHLFHKASSSNLLASVRPTPQVFNLAGCKMSARGRDELQVTASLHFWLIKSPISIQMKYKFKRKRKRKQKRNRWIQLRGCAPCPSRRSPHFRFCFCFRFNECLILDWNCTA